MMMTVTVTVMMMLMIRSSVSGVRTKTFDEKMHDTHAARLTDSLLDLLSTVVSIYPYTVCLPYTSYIYTCDDGVYHTPLGRFSRLDCSITKKRVPAPNDRIRLRKALGEMFPTPSFFLHRHYSNCGLQLWRYRP